MSRHLPGTKDWWVETALITAGGVALAIWLWDGPAFERGETIEAAEQGPAQPAPRTLGELFDRGCMDAEALAALRDGRRFTARCPMPPEGVRAPQGPPPSNRPFP